MTRFDCGIVLAGGRGVRLGMARPKALVELAGATLLDRTLATLGVCCDEVIVVGPAALALGEPETVADHPHASIEAGAPVPARGNADAKLVLGSVRRVFDAEGFEGPLAGLVAGLEHAQGTVAVLGVDFPLVTPALLTALFARLDSCADAVVSRPGGIAQPLVSVLRAAAAPRLRETLEAGVSSLRGGLERLAVRWLDDAAIAQLPGGALALLNVNTPADLAAARAALSRRHEVAS